MIPLPILCGAKAAVNLPAVATLLDFAENNGTETSITSNSLAGLTAADALLVFGMCRRTGATAANALTTTLANAVITSVENVEADNGSVWIRNRCQLITFTGAPGVGTVTQPFGAGAFQQVLAVVKLVGFNAGAPIGEKKSSVASSGTGATTTFDGAPASSSRVIVGYAQNGNAAITQPSGHDSLREAAIGTNMSYEISHRTGDASTGRTSTGGNNQPKAQIIVEVRD